MELNQFKQSQTPLNKGQKRWRIVFQKLANSSGKGEENIGLNAANSINIKQLKSYLRSEQSYKVGGKKYFFLNSNHAFFKRHEAIKFQTFYPYSSAYKIVVFQFRNVSLSINLNIENA